MDADEEVEERPSGSEASAEEEEEPPVVLRTLAVMQRPPDTNAPTGDLVSSRGRSDDGRCSRVCATFDTNVL